MKRATGRIVVVQENRFRLVTDSGRAHLFILAHDAAVEAQDLPPLQREQTRVAVDYSDSPDRIAFIAHRLTDHPARRTMP